MSGSRLLTVAVVLAVPLALAAGKAAKRSDLRSFYTAPPVIPHEVEDDRGSESCAACHAEVMDLGDRVTVQTPHPEFTNCQQCHVPAARPGRKAPKVENTWKGLEEPREGVRTNPEAPPTIPHRLFLREKCLTCHGPENPNKAMRTQHPERTSCQQCHIADERRQF